jgi:hypothetical protein
MTQRDEGYRICNHQLVCEDNSSSNYLCSSFPALFFLSWIPFFYPSHYHAVNNWYQIRSIPWRLLIPASIDWAGNWIWLVILEFILSFL